MVGGRLTSRARCGCGCSLTCEHTVRQPAGADMNCLSAADGDVWGGVGMRWWCGGGSEPA